MARVVAVDGGGTSTRCVVVESGGRCLGLATGGSGNPVSAGWSSASAAVAHTTVTALTQAGLTGADIDAVVLSIAGAGTVETDGFAEPLRALGIASPPVHKPDILASYCAGTPALDGYALVAGTGATGARIEGGEVAAVADGLGWLVGDVGSGFWIGHQVVRAAFAGLDGRGPRTALSERVLADLGLAEDGRRDEFGRPWVMAPALRQVYALRPVEVSRFAHLAFADDDPVAQGIVAAAASGLAATLATVADARVRGPLVLAGGVVSRHPRLVQTIAATCADTLPATDYLTQSDGTTGAAVLALREAGDTVDAHVFDVITATLTSLRAPGTV